MLRPSFRPATAILLILLARSVAGEEGPEVPFSLPTPEGWRSETLPFPLSFAPELEYQGLEELRFAPGMFEPDSEGFWTYAFLWWLPLETRLDADGLAADLEVYFRGLTRSVAEERGFDPGEPEVSAELRETPDAGKRDRWLIGKVKTLDAFATREPIELSVSIRIWRCAAEERLVAFFELSPQPAYHQLWRTLRQIRKGFRCQAEAESDAKPESRSE